MLSDAISQDHKIRDTNIKNIAMLWFFTHMMVYTENQLIKMANCIKQKQAVKHNYIKNMFSDFPGGTVVKSPPANAGDMGSSPGQGRSHMRWSN